MFRFTLNSSGKGQIQIDDFFESFYSDFSFWSKADYEEHWLKATVALEAGNSVSFISSITNPDNANFISTWTCYVIKNELILQENLLFLNDIPFKFNIAEAHKNVLPYESVSEDGEEISEWRTKI